MLRVIWVEEGLRFSHMVPAVQARQVYPALRVDVFTLPYEHAGSGSQKADGRREGKGLQEPQQDGQVIRVPCQYTTIHTHMNQAVINHYCISDTPERRRVPP